MSKCQEWLGGVLGKCLTRFEGSPYLPCGSPGILIVPGFLSEEIYFELRSFLYQLVTCFKFTWYFLAICPVVYIFMLYSGGVWTCTSHLQTMKTRVGLLSGGQKARLQLALFLYRKPDLLIVDEPTNHLDIKSIVALENFLKEFEGSVLLITHDRELIEAVGGRVVGIEDKQIKPVWID